MKALKALKATAPEFYPSDPSGLSIEQNGSGSFVFGAYNWKRSYLSHLAFEQHYLKQAIDAYKVHINFCQKQVQVISERLEQTRLPLQEN